MNKVSHLMIWKKNSVQNLCLGTDRPEHAVQTQIRLLLKEQSDQGLHCLPFHPHLMHTYLHCKNKATPFRLITDKLQDLLKRDQAFQQLSLVSKAVISIDFFTLLMT